MIDPLHLKACPCIHIGIGTVGIGRHHRHTYTNVGTIGILCLHSGARTSGSINMLKMPQNRVFVFQLFECSKRNLTLVSLGRIKLNFEYN